MCGSFLSSKWFDYIFEFKIQSFKFKLFKKFNFFEIRNGSDCGRFSRQRSKGNTKNQGLVFGIGRTRMD